MLFSWMRMMMIFGVGVVRVWYWLCIGERWEWGGTTRTYLSTLSVPLLLVIVTRVYIHLCTAVTILGVVRARLVAWFADDGPTVDVLLLLRIHATLA